MTCTNDCNQGRECGCKPANLGATRYEQDPTDAQKSWRYARADDSEIVFGGLVKWPKEPTTPTIWQHLWDYAVGFLAALGAMALVACIGLYLGGYFEFLMKELNK
jgi:hypothetical protein